jgi:hypothetical protein
MLYCRSDFHCTLLLKENEATIIPPYANNFEAWEYDVLLTMEETNETLNKFH